MRILALIAASLALLVAWLPGESRASSALVCGTPLACIADQQGTDAQNTALWNLLTQSSGRSTVQVGGTSTWADMEAAVSDPTGIEGDLSGAVLDSGVGTALDSSLLFAGLSGIAIPITVGAASYFAIKYVIGSSDTYYRLQLDPLGVGGVVVPSPMPTDTTLETAAWVEPPSGYTGFTGDYVFVDQYKFHSPTYSSKYYSGRGAYPIEPNAWNGVSSYDPGFLVRDCVVGEGSDPVTNFLDSTQNTAILSCISPAFAGQYGHGTPNSSSPEAAVTAAIESTFANVGSLVTLGGFHEQADGGGTERGLVISSSGMFADLGTAELTDPGAEVGTATIPAPAISSTPDLAKLALAVPALEASPCTEALVNSFLDASFPAPTCSGGASNLITLPQPPSTGTCDDYITLLATVGYTGSASCITLPEISIDTTVGPSAVSKITWTPAPGGTPITVASTSWPYNPPVLDPNATLVIAQNPTDAPPVAGTNGQNGAVVPPSAVTCTCPPIDFSPLTGLSLGTKFPFGVFNWLNASIGDTSVSAAPLSFDVTKPGGGSIHVVLASTWWEDTGRPIAFPVAEFLMTLGMFYFFATKILGLGGGD